MSTGFEMEVCQMTFLSPLKHQLALNSHEIHELVRKLSNQLKVDSETCFSAEAGMALQDSWKSREEH